MRRSASAAAVLDAQPMGELNITPLIDVMLVLLVMFILSVPPMTHKVPIELPVGRAPDSTPPVTHRLSLDAAGVARLDGAAADGAALRARLIAIEADPAAQLVMATDPATRYARFDEVLAEVKRAGVTRLGFEGNDRWADADWGR